MFHVKHPAVLCQWTGMCPVRPYAVGEAFRTNGKLVRRRGLVCGAGRSPPPTEGAEQGGASGGGVHLGCGFRQPNSETEFGASVIGIGPYGEKGKFPQPPGPAAHSGASTPAVARDGRGSEQGSPPKGPSTPDNPSVTAAADSSLYTREPWDGDADCHVGPAGLLAMTTVFCHSEERSDVGIRFPLVGSRDRPGSA